MKVRLLNPQLDPPIDPAGPWNAHDLRQDLGLDTVVHVMAGGNDLFADVARGVLLAPVRDPAVVRHRQAVLADCLDDPEPIRAMYHLAVEANTRERKVFLGSLANHPSYLLSRSVEVMAIYVDVLGRLRTLVEQHSAGFRSDGLRRLAESLQAELSDAYLADVSNHLKRLRRRDALLISARLGKGNGGTDYVLRLPVNHHDGLLGRLTGSAERSYSFTIPPRDDAGMRALEELSDRGRNHTANALAQSADHVRDFFRRLQSELAFYLGCVQLYAELTARGHAVCWPVPHPSGSRRLTATGLYDAVLALSTTEPIVPNDIAADGSTLVVITGANQGGKSTLLRAIGTATLMAQAGMFVPATMYEADLASAIATHYKREEDPSMVSGKFDEELVRMRAIVDPLEPNTLMLFNESFAATNEQEGSEIGWQVIRALTARGAKVLLVTHLFDLANRLRDQAAADTLFLRANRNDDGTRDFKIHPGDPRPTSFGRDIYRKVFGAL